MSKAIEGTKSAASKVGIGIVSLVPTFIAIPMCAFFYLIALTTKSNYDAAGIKFDKSREYWHLVGASFGSMVILGLAIAATIGLYGFFTGKFND